jgi:hypothetical protein
VTLRSCLRPLFYRCESPEHTFPAREPYKRKSFAGLISGARFAGRVIGRRCEGIETPLSSLIIRALTETRQGSSSHYSGTRPEPNGPRMCTRKLPKG